MMRRRLANAYLSSVISISLVLLLVGIAALLLMNARSVSDYFKENMEVSVVMRPTVSEEDALAFMEELAEEEFVNSSEFVSKEQGELEMVELLGEDFMDILDSSPIPASISLTLHASYVSSDSLEVVKAKIMEEPLVEEVSYQKGLVDALNANFTRISAVLAVFIVLLLFISYVLINNTVRLNVFARRFTIHTMKLVGATRAFIRAPFLGRAAVQGLISALLANAALVGLLYALKDKLGQLFEAFSPGVLVIVACIVLAAGVLICVVSTFFVVNRLVALEKDELYY
ncbi:MAG: permease-like cell division protein FtsX [Bacteroidales bacterium]|nr:permease-like cell division protein FtsX [Bacteroidales bacterium]